MTKRRQQGAVMVAILAALEQINLAAAMGQLPQVEGYQIEPLRLPEILPKDEALSSTFALADLFAESMARPNLVLTDKINSLIVESRAELEAYIAEYHDLYGEQPPALNEDSVDVPSIAEAEGIASAVDAPDVATQAQQSGSILPGLSNMPVKTPEAGMNDEGQVEIVTGLLPKTEIDPRDSTYKSENEVLQKALDVVAVVDQLAAPIRTGIAEEAYNNTVEAWNGSGKQ